MLYISTTPMSPNFNNTLTVNKQDIDGALVHFC